MVERSTPDGVSAASSACGGWRSGQRNVIVVLPNLSVSPSLNRYLPLSRCSLTNVPLLDIPSSTRIQALAGPFEPRVQTRHLSIPAEHEIGGRLAPDRGVGQIGREREQLLPAIAVPEHQERSTRELGLDASLVLGLGIGGGVRRHLFIIYIYPCPVGVERVTGSRWRRVRHPERLGCGPNVSYQPRSSRTESRIGSNVGRYQVESVLGVGGMGVVYRASDPDGSPVALKLVKEEFALDETLLRRFRREANIAQTVGNPHVVPVLDTGEHDGLPYLVERLLEGGSLAHKLQEEGCLEVPAAVRICSQVADGLGALWAAGIVHRDVKPSNILLDGAQQAYITDFGLAKSSQGTALTRPGQALGSMDYMAPEQIRGETVTAATDIYALGCVVFECIQGRPPFADRQGIRALWAHLQDEPPDPVRDGLPPQFVPALKLALRKEPGERPATGLEYAQLLSAAAGIPPDALGPDP